MKKPTISVKSGIFYLLFIAVFLSILIPNSLWIHSTINNYKEDASDLKKASILKQKQVVRDVVNDVLHYIHYKRQHCPDQSREEIQAEILDYLATIRFGNGGHIFVNRYDGKALIFHGERVTGELDIKDLTDPTGKRLFAIEMDLAQKPGGGYMQYLFKKLDGDTPLPKLSYVIGLPDWQWIIGAGEYLDDASREIKIIQARMIRNLNAKVVRIVLLLALFTLILIFLSTLVSMRLEKQFTVFRNFFKSSVHNDKLLDVNLLQLKELKEIAVHANEMVLKRQKIQNELFAIQENLKSKTALLNNILQSAPGVAIITTDLDFEITYINSQAEKLLEKNAEELIDKSISQTKLHDNLTDEFLRVVARHLEQNDAYNAIFEISDEHGRIFIDMTVAGIHNVDADLTGYLFFCRDITEKKQAEDELLKYRQHLEQLVRERTAELERLNNELLKKNQDLEHFNELFIGREFRIKELRDKVKRLEHELSRLHRN